MKVDPSPTVPSMSSETHEQELFILPYFQSGHFTLGATRNFIIAAESCRFKNILCAVSIACLYLQTSRANPLTQVKCSVLVLLPWEHCRGYLGWWCFWLRWLQNRNLQGLTGVSILQNVIRNHLLYTLAVLRSLPGFQTCEKSASTYPKPWDHTGGSVLKNLSSNTGKASLIPGWGTEIPHVWVAKPVL